MERHRWAVLAAFVVISIATYLSFATNGFTATKLNRFVCVAGPSETLKYLRCIDAYDRKDWSKADKRRIAACKERHKDDPGKTCVLSDRYRFNFSAFQRDFPNVSARVSLLRDRVRDLRAANREFADQSFNRHLFINLVAFTLLLVVALFKTSAAAEEPRPEAPATERAWATVKQFSGTAAILAALVLAVSQTFSFHTQFKAAMVAERAYDGLAMRIDTELINMYWDARTAAKSDDPAKIALTGITTKAEAWVKDFSQIRTSFAKAYGDAFQPPKAKSLTQ